MSNDFSLDTVLGTTKITRIKSFKKEGLLKNEEDLLFMLSEIQILRELEHSNVILLYEVYEEQETINLVMEYAEGGDLFNKIITKGKYSEPNAAKFIKELLETVLYYQKKSILHRNLKLENILFL